MILRRERRPIRHAATRSPYHSPLRLQVVATAGQARGRIPGSGRAVVGGVRVSARVRGRRDDGFTVHVRVWNPSPDRVDVRVRVVVEEPEPSPWWLVPGVFYGENRLPACERLYPRWDPGGGDPALLVSDTWAVRADRCATPLVFLAGSVRSVALAVDETTELGQSGVGFHGDGRRASAWVDLPYEEAPVSFTDQDTAAAPARQVFRLGPGARAAAEVRVSIHPAGRHAYDRLLRAEYRRHRGNHPLNPWMAPAEAAELAAAGLVRWHHHDGPPALWETAAFDRRDAASDRAAMHVGWLSGTPSAAALLEHARRTGDEATAEKAIGVLDTVAAGVSPGGFFWGQWTRAGGWGHGWNRHPGRLHARTLSEATLFLIRALRAEDARGVGHPAWRSAIASNLDAALRVQEAGGSFGGYYDAETGTVVDGRGAGGILWCAALCEAAPVLGRPELLDAALRGGRWYAGFVENGCIYGAPEDVHLCPTSEDGYNAIMAYVALAEATGDSRWWRLARRAAEWTMTFRLSYNVRFPPGSQLGRVDFRSRGADIASPSNQHLHSYGLICLPELLRLADRFGDAYLRERAEDNLACFLQLVARWDGDFGARRGMVSERYHHTDWAAPKGSLLPLSHAWCCGVLLGACLYVQGRHHFPLEARRGTLIAQSDAV